MQVWPLWLAGLVALAPMHLLNLLCELRDVISPISASSFLVKDKELRTLLGDDNGDSHPNPSTAAWWDWRRPVLLAPVRSGSSPLPYTWSPKPCPTPPGPNLR